MVPPSTPSTWPLTNDASFDARKRMTAEFPASRRPAAVSLVGGGAKDILPSADNHHVYPIGRQRGRGGSSDARPAA
jgi:hypothetical protein